MKMAACACPPGTSDWLPVCVCLYLCVSGSSSGGVVGGKKKEVVVAITGASGMLGRALTQELTGDDTYIYTYTYTCLCLLTGLTCARYSTLYPVVPVLLRVMDYGSLVGSKVLSSVSVCVV